MYADCESALRCFNGYTTPCRKRCISNLHGIFSYSIDLRFSVNLCLTIQEGLWKISKSQAFPCHAWVFFFIIIRCIFSTSTENLLWWERLFCHWRSIMYLHFRSVLHSISKWLHLYIMQNDDLLLSIFGAPLFFPEFLNKYLWYWLFRFA